MNLTVESEHLGGVKVLAHDTFEDDRGFFMEVFRADVFASLGIPTDFPQDNHSRSSKGVLRGLHFQWDPPMGKLMRVTLGRAYLVAVDIRKGSPTIGQWFGIELASEDRKQVWAPPGFARGFCVLSDVAEIQYKCTGIYNPQGESGILWNDPAIAINWPIENPSLSKKDAEAQTLAEWLSRQDSCAFTF